MSTRTVTRWLDMAGLDFLSPLVRLACRDEPLRQLRTIARGIGIPMLGIGGFLLLWTLIASSIETAIGSLPTPREVWIEARNLVNDHFTEREKERAFYASQQEVRARFEARFPNRQWQDRKYAGRPTYLDQIGTSLKTVFAGFLLASCVAVPLGILCGMSRNFHTAINPFIQLFKPVSPLAWLPIVMIVVSAVYNPAEPMFEKSFISSAVTVALCSLWPALMNTALGVTSIDRDHLNVARALQLGTWTKVRKIVIPSALPLIFTGLRLSLGVGWMVLIAAEMLAQNPGLGKFVWDMFQNGSSSTLAQIMVAVLTIGGIGFFLDRMMVVLQRMVSYEPAAAGR